MNKRDEKFWDRQAGSFANHGDGVNLSGNRDFKAIMQYLDSTDRVLDYGCATGIIANAIAGKAGKIDAIDISPKMIEIAKTKAHELGISNVNYMNATIFDDRLREESFNMILAFRVLHMVEDPRAVLRRINRLLKPGGVFISVAAFMGAFKTLLSVPIFLMGKMGILPEHIKFFKLADLQSLMAEEDLQISECERMDDRIPCYCITARKPKWNIATIV